ncbi:MAG: hypothetical protein LW808_002245 [Verrucomicrobiota bacterium]|nr:MAG: hypothetical protein LW808_002245 [Verrucomicrobiota bacterium]
MLYASENSFNENATTSLTDTKNLEYLYQRFISLKASYYNKVQEYWLFGYSEYEKTINDDELKQRMMERDYYEICELLYAAEVLQEEINALSQVPSSVENVAKKLPLFIRQMEGDQSGSSLRSDSLKILDYCLSFQDAVKGAETLASFRTYVQIAVFEELCFLLRNPQLKLTEDRGYKHLFAFRNVIDERVSKELKQELSVYPLLAIPLQYRLRFVTSLNQTEMKVLFKNLGDHIGYPACQKVSPEFIKGLYSKLNQAGKRECFSLMITYMKSWKGSAGVEYAFSELNQANKGRLFPVIMNYVRQGSICRFSRERMYRSMNKYNQSIN